MTLQEVSHRRTVVQYVSYPIVWETTLKKAVTCTLLYDFLREWLQPPTTKTNSLVSMPKFVHEIQLARK